MSAPELLPCQLSDKRLTGFLEQLDAGTLAVATMINNFRAVVTELQSLRSARQPGQDAAGDVEEK